jgi:hypothetical protein
MKAVLRRRFGKPIFSRDYLTRNNTVWFERRPVKKVPGIERERAKPGVIGVSWSECGGRRTSRACSRGRGTRPYYGKRL